jgi:hypothetical protein
MNKITGQVIYCGPMIPALGLQLGTIFRNGLHEQHYRAIEQCPSLGELFVRVQDYGAVRRELNFDIARNMRGTSGKHVTFYNQVQNWIASRARTGQTSPPPVTTRELKQYAR